MINATLYAYQSLGLLYMFIIPLMMIMLLFFACAKIVKGMIRSLKK